MRVIFIRDHMVDGNTFKKGESFKVIAMFTSNINYGSGSISDQDSLTNDIKKARCVIIEIPDDSSYDSWEGRKGEQCYDIHGEHIKYLKINGCIHGCITSCKPDCPFREEVVG